ncbi:hypothetical protein G6F32_016461 [Rhizopus arrhizus]|nr:hypothetical protein G6F32_016461 [Rhizopus arrhizus]
MSASALLMAAFTFSTISGGVPAGAKRPNQAATSKPSTPDSAMVGISGAKGTRAAVVTARPVSLPARTCGSSGGRLSKMESTCPPSKSATAGPLPR